MEGQDPNAELSNAELRLGDVPSPPLFKLAEEGGEDVFMEATVGGAPARVGAVFASGELAAGFSAEAQGFGAGAFAGLGPRELTDWGAVEVYAAAGEDYVLVVSDAGTGLFHADDLARRAADEGRGAAREGAAPGTTGGAEGMPFPLYVLSDEKGESPLISVETDGGEVSVAALFSSPEKARAFREKAAHLDLPAGLGTIDDGDGLGRHALVARRAGADYAVVDPDAGLTEAIPLEELAR